MKRIKGLMATMLILSIMIGNTGWVINLLTNSVDTTIQRGVFKILEEPDPVGR